MALGGGNFSKLDKILPGTYINFISAKEATNDSQNGIVACPASLDWGSSGVIALTKEQFFDNAFTVLGYDPYSPELINIRELFCHANKVYLVRINTSQNAAKASNDFATARYCGTRGNAIVIKVSAEVGAETFKVETFVGTKLVDTQTGVATASDLVDNEWVVFNTSATLAANAGVALIGGTNSTPTVSDWTSALGLLESKTFNALCVDSLDTDVLGAAVAYTKRQRDEVGNKFQAVLETDTAPDSEGVINLSTKADDGSTLVYWASGLISSCALNASCTNAKYDGEKIITSAPTSTELEQGLGAGKFILHMSGEDIVVLEDINSLITYTDEKNKDFASNQTVRVIDCYAKSLAGLFSSKYLGKIPNDKGGRVSLWSDIISIKKDLVQSRSIEPFDNADIVVAKGDTSDSVVISDSIQPINAMTKLYVTVVIN